MVSAPAALGTSARRQRRAGSAPVGRSVRPASVRARSAPARLSVGGRGRRAFSASPSLRSWAGPPARRPASKGRPSSLAKMLTGALALQGIMMGAGGPYVGGRPGRAPSTALAIYPLGSSAPYVPESKTYPLPVAGRSVIEWTRPRRAPGRKAFPGGQAPSDWYEPRMRQMDRLGAARKLGVPVGGASVPVPVISARDVIYLTEQGFIFPRKVMEQALMGQPITANKRVPNWARDPEALPQGGLRRLAEMATRPVPNRFSKKTQLALPPGVTSALRAIEGRVEKAAALGLAKTIAGPILAGRYVASLPGRAAASVASKVQSGVARARSIISATRAAGASVASASRAHRRSTKKIPR